mmetsp:Transcript_18826/g.44092  ORF Transcript_18826/g.44092 Transcript_18826/m.44092 type:complete len:486 (-) Transcript_18826:3013-4470(-)
MSCRPSMTGAVSPVTGGTRAGGDTENTGRGGRSRHRRRRSGSETSLSGSRGSASAPLDRCPKLPARSRPGSIKRGVPSDDTARSRGVCGAMAEITAARSVDVAAPPTQASSAPAGLPSPKNDKSVSSHTRSSDSSTSSNLARLPIARVGCGCSRPGSCRSSSATDGDASETRCIRRLSLVCKLRCRGRQSNRRSSSSAGGPRLPDRPANRPRVAACSFSCACSCTRSTGSWDSSDMRITHTDASGISGPEEPGPVSTASSPKNRSLGPAASAPVAGDDGVRSWAGVVRTRGERAGGSTAVRTAGDAAITPSAQRVSHSSSHSASAATASSRSGRGTTPPPSDTGRSAVRTRANTPASRPVTCRGTSSLRTVQATRGPRAPEAAVAVAAEAVRPRGRDSAREECRLRAARRNECPAASSAASRKRLRSSLRPAACARRMSVQIAERASRLRRRRRGRYRPSSTVVRISGRQATDARHRHRGESAAL